VVVDGPSTAVGPLASGFWVERQLTCQHWGSGATLTLPGIAASSCSGIAVDSNIPNSAAIREVDGQRALHEGLRLAMTGGPLSLIAT